MSTDGRITAMARGLAGFVGMFALVNAITLLRRGSDGNVWWIDLRPLPGLVNAIVAMMIAAVLLMWAIAPRISRGRRALMTALLVFAIGAALVNAITFYRLYFTRAILTPIPVPFSMLVVLALALILARSLRGVLERLRPVTFALGFFGAAVAFPLAQIALFGQTDYRRPAEAIVVFGARAYADGSPSDALGDRILTAIALYKKGLAPRMILSGGPGDGAITEAQAMRRIALDAGIPDDALILDDAGLNTDATVSNTRRLLQPDARVLAVSHNWHLPRIKMRFEREGLRAYTTPADTRGQPLRNTPYLILREIPAIWLYWLRGAL